MSQRTDAFGRAYAGSQLQIQTYVNRRRAELNTAILHAIPELGTAGAHLEWVSPVEDERFKEYQDGGFLSALGLLDVSGMLAEFWPQGGPVWDALARVTLPGSECTGVLLVEAKSYPQEMYSSGCCASDVSRGQIVTALQRTQQWLELEPADWTGPLYQSANRLAHLYFLRELAGVPTWFVNLCFAGDPHRPTPPTIWRDALKAVKVALCLPETVPFCADIILEAAGRELFQTPAPVFAGSLSAFEDEVNRGLMDLVTARFPGRLVMDFSFEHLPADFDWRPGSGSAGRLLERRTAVYDSRHGIH